MNLKQYLDKGQRSISLHLIFSVNLVLGVLLLGLLAMQYERDMRHSINEKQTSLKDEAVAIHAAIVHLADEHDLESVQDYIDSVTHEMRGAWSPYHHIAIDLKDVKLTRSCENCEKCMCSVPVDSGNSPAMSGNDKETVSGNYAASNISVTVSETRENIQLAVRNEIIIRMLVLASLGLLAALLVNVILLRIVGRPLNRLLNTVNQIGKGHFGVEVRVYESHEMQQLANGINAMSRTLAENARRQQLQMTRARQIQTHLLPNGIEIPGLNADCVFEPAEDVAGDYYDFLPLSDGKWLICMADVMGHGVPAAMGAALLKALLLAESEGEQFDLSTSISLINRRFESSILPGNFASMILGIWDPTTGTFTYVNAGHEPILIQRSEGNIERLESTGTLLGIDTHMKWTTHKVRLSSGDRLLLYSDGAKEVHDANGKIFGMERLSQLLVENRESTDTETMKNLLNEINSHGGAELRHDDLTLVLLTCTIPEDSLTFNRKREAAME
ncbi:MAG: SpoIIE family protein phosphatase [Planctomycetaceae bacterium]